MRTTTIFGRVGVDHHRYRGLAGEEHVLRVGAERVRRNRECTDGEPAGHEQ